MSEIEGKCLNFTDDNGWNIGWDYGEISLFVYKFFTTFYRWDPSDFNCELPRVAGHHDYLLLRQKECSPCYEPRPQQEPGPLQETSCKGGC